MRRTKALGGGDDGPEPGSVVLSGTTFLWTFCCNKHLPLNPGKREIILTSFCYRTKVQKVKQMHSQVFFIINKYILFAAILMLMSLASTQA